LANLERPGRALSYRAFCKTWATVLNRIQVTGGTEKEKELFYSCLFRQFWFPNLSSDAGAELENLGSPALWDVFRTQLVLLDMLVPDVSGEIINSMLRGSALSGFLPTSFHGDFGSAYIAGSYLRGVRGYDVHRAYSYMLNNANTADGNRARPHNKIIIGGKPLDGWFVAYADMLSGHELDIYVK
jgi:putative alpha-1,2-mannosidase